MQRTIMEMPELSGLNLIPEGDARQLTSYSFWNCFRNCRKAAYWRYVEGLRPMERAGALAQGDAIHQALEQWYRYGGICALQAVDRNIFPDYLPAGMEHVPLSALLRTDDLPEWFTLADPSLRARWHAVTAMMNAYIATYPTENWEMIGLEVPFVGEIINPATGASSRTFLLGGRVDGIVKTEDGYFILEHKTTSRLDAGYLDKLWTDMQIQLYATYLKPHGEDIRGVIYNILEKPTLKQKMGETAEEFELRKANMKQPGRAKRQLPESDREFQDRLAAWFLEHKRFHREVIYFTPADQHELRSNLWELTQQYLEAARSAEGVGFYKNTNQCFVWNRPCDYVHLCRAGGDEATKAAFYTKNGQPADLTADSSAGNGDELAW